MGTQPQPVEVPEIPLALLRHLEFVYGEQRPRPTDSHAEIMFAAGARSVVQYLRVHFDKQQ